MTANPVDLVYVDGAAVSKAAVRAHSKLRLSQRVANADELRNTLLVGQQRVHVASLTADFRLDTSDMTTADDGTNCIISLDGYRFKRISSAAAAVSSTVVATGDVTIADDEPADVIWIENTSGGPITVYWPDASRGGQLEVKDYGGNAGTHAITLRPKAAASPTQYLMGAASYELDVNNSGLKLTARPDGLGWG